MITTYSGKNTYIANKQINERIKKIDPLNVVDLPCPTLKKLAEHTISSPLMATRKVIIVHSLENLGTQEKIISVLENKRTTSHIIFVLGGYGKNYEKLATYLRKSQIIKINLFDIKLAKEYTKKEAKKLGLIFDDTILDYFLFVVGHTPEAIDSELSNLNHPYIKNVSQNNIRTYVSRRSDTNIFKLTQAWFIKNPGYAIDLLDQFVQDNPPVNMLSFVNLLISDLRLAIFIKSCKDNNLPVNRIPANPYRIKKIKSATENFTLYKLINFYCTVNQAVYEKSREGMNPLPTLYKGFFEFRGR